MKGINSKGQSWSIDIALAVVIFIGAFFAFYGLLYSNPNEKTKALKDEAATVIKQVASEDAKLNVINMNEVNISKINQLKNISYDELKSMLRIEGDICLYFEDDKGNIILINESYRGVGSSIINLSGVPCSQK